MVLQTLFSHLKIDLEINVFLRKKIGKRHDDFFHAGHFLEIGFKGQNIVSRGRSAGKHDCVILGGQTIHGAAFRKQGIKKQKHFREREMIALDSANCRDGAIRIFEFFLVHVERSLLAIRSIVLPFNRLQPLKLEIKNEIYAHEDTQIEHFQDAYQKELPQKKAEVQRALCVFLVFFRQKIKQSLHIRRGLEAPGR